MELFYLTQYRGLFFLARVENTLKKNSAVFFRLFTDVVSRESNTFVTKVYGKRENLSA